MYNPKKSNRQSIDTNTRQKMSNRSVKIAQSRECPKCHRKAALCKDVFCGWVMRYCKYCDYTEPYK